MSEEVHSDPPQPKKLPEQIQDQQRHFDEKEEQQIQASSDIKSDASLEKTLSPNRNVSSVSAFSNNSSPPKIVPPPPPPGPPPQLKTTRSKSNPRRSSVSPLHKRAPLQSTTIETDLNQHGNKSKTNLTSNHKISNKSKPHLKTTTKRGVAEIQRKKSPHRHEGLANSTIKKQSNYQFAMHEFKQTIEHSLSNDDGLGPGPRSPGGRSRISGGVRHVGTTSHGSYVRHRNVRDVTAGVHQYRPQNTRGMSILRMQQGLKSNATNVVMNDKIYRDDNNYPPDTYSPPITPVANKSEKNQVDEFSTAAALAYPSISNTSTSDTPNTSSTLNSNNSTKSNNTETKAMHDNLDTLNEGELHLKLHADKLTEVERNDGNSPHNILPSQTSNHDLNEAAATITTASFESNEILQMQSHAHDKSINFPYGEMVSPVLVPLISFFLLTPLNLEKILFYLTFSCLYIMCPLKHVECRDF